MVPAEELRKASLFKSLSDDQLNAILKLGQGKSFEPGEEIFKQGEKAKILYVLLDGVVTMMFTLGTEAEEETDLLVETLEEGGSVFGTAALVNPYLYNVTARCTKPTRTFAIGAAGFREIVRRDPVIGFEVMTKLAQRYFDRLNTTRAAITNLFRTFTFQTRKPKVPGTRGDSK